MLFTCPRTSIVVPRGRCLRNGVQHFVDIARHAAQIAPFGADVDVVDRLHVVVVDDLRRPRMLESRPGWTAVAAWARWMPSYLRWPSSRWAEWACSARSSMLRISRCGV